MVDLIEARIVNIRAERKGEGRTLTPQGARALAGEWYSWFTAHMATNKWTEAQWRAYRESAWDGLHGVMDVGPPSDDPFEHVDMNSSGRSSPMKLRWRNSSPLSGFNSIRRRVTCSSITWPAISSQLWICWCGGRAATLAQDDYAKRFPKQGEGVADPDLTPWSLFEKWIAEVKPAASTVDRWRAVFLKLQSGLSEHCRGRVVA